tara:strand:+ start:146 stop:283 length:138 start_codon:yes stop_codon:yes gene_type:complete
MEKIEIKVTLSEEEVKELWSVIRDIQSTLQDVNTKLDELQQKDKG